MIRLLWINYISFTHWCSYCLFVITFNFLSDSEVRPLVVSWNGCITDSTVCPAGFEDLLDGQKETEHHKRQTDNHVKFEISGESECAHVCWRKHTTTAACHFSLSTKSHLFWIKRCPPPLPSALLCIYHVVYSKVISNMRAPFFMCCSTTNHRASDKWDNAQSCRVFSPHLSLLISSQISLRAACSGETLTVWRSFSNVPWKFIHFSIKSDSSLQFLLFPEHF